jgi:hypothetical protein
LPAIVLIALAALNPLGAMGESDALERPVALDALGILGEPGAPAEHEARLRWTLWVVLVGRRRGDSTCRDHVFAFTSLANKARCSRPRELCDFVVPAVAFRGNSHTAAFVQVKAIELDAARPVEGFLLLARASKTIRAVDVVAAAQRRHAGSPVVRLVELKDP